LTITKDMQESHKISKSESKSGLSRKDFLFSTAGLVALVGGLPRYGFANAFSALPLKGTNQAILYDASKCIGCRMCESACRIKNNLPQGNEPGKLSKTSWTAIRTTKDGNKADLFLKLQCLHCTDASCVSVCPTGAAAHQGESVVINQDVCIGCGYCEESCPFGVPHTSPPKGTAQKCDFCFDLVKAGSKPACVETCPIGALTFGARADILTTAKKKVQVLRKSGWPDAQLYGEDRLGGLSVIYILLKTPVFYGLPEQPRQATKNVLEKWASGSLVAAALIVPFWYFYKRRSGKDKQSAKQKEGAE
jgi:Fe-S-cluster-containing dehydrogenase component